MTAARLYTFGYQGRSLAVLQGAAEELDAFVVDVRYKAMARAPEWRVSRLKQALDWRYVPAGAWLGNVNYKIPGARVQLADEPEGLAWLARQLEIGKVILLCVCRDVKTCHRRYIADRMLEAYGVLVTDL